MLYGRGIYFASSDFLRLEFMRVNNREDKFREALVPYMEKMMKETPKGSWVTPHFDTEMFIAMLKQTGKDKKPSVDLMKMRAQNLFKFRSRSIDYLTRWADYFWRISPSDKKTKELIARWLDYTVAINPYYIKGPLNSSALLVKTGNKKLAISNLEKSIKDMSDIYLDETDEVKQLEQMLRDVKNDKL